MPIATPDAGKDRLKAFKNKGKDTEVSFFHDIFLLTIPARIFFYFPSFSNSPGCCSFFRFFRFAGIFEKFLRFSRFSRIHRIFEFPSFSDFHGFFRIPQFSRIFPFLGFFGRTLEKLVKIKYRIFFRNSVVDVMKSPWICVNRRKTTCFPKGGMFAWKMTSRQVLYKTPPTRSPS